VGENPQRRLKNLQGLTYLKEFSFVDVFKASVAYGLIFQKTLKQKQKFTAKMCS
jgi:hypothetical protein